MKRRIVKVVVVVIVAWMLVASLAPRALVLSAPLASADAIVVLSGASAYVERTRKAAELYREGRAPLVLLTDDNTRGGWSSAKQTNPFFVERAKEELINAGVPADRIRVVPGVAFSTRGEAILLKEYAEEERFRSVLIVTSSYHSRRALRTMEQVFAG
ncbi:MAG TPA: YdcF family protein, partial [Pyrinomonadaceae bacterium]|nr:YdcF family protein [Pyrinomonadaceae bacterium]